MNSDEPHFHPWVGTRYKEGLSGVKVMILGESHYLWDGYRGRDESRNVVRQIVETFPSKGFWRRVTIGFIGHLPTAGERRDLWDSLAFYEFIQEPMQTHKTRPTASQWRAAPAPFLQIVERLRPDLIVVFGKGVWKHLPGTAKTADVVSDGESSADTYLIPVGGGHTALAVSFKHPSAGFGGYKHHPLVRAAIAAAVTKTSKP